MLHWKLILIHCFYSEFKAASLIITTPLPGTTLGPILTSRQTLTPPGQGSGPDSPPMVSQPTPTDVVPSIRPSTASAVTAQALPTTEAPSATPNAASVTQGAVVTTGGPSDSTTPQALLVPNPIFGFSTTPQTLNPPTGPLSAPQPQYPFTRFTHVPQGQNYIQRLLPLIFALRSDNPILPFLLSQPQRQPLTTTSMLGGLGPLALLNENIGSMYAANTFANRFGGGLLGNLAAANIFDVPDFYLMGTLLQGLSGNRVLQTPRAVDRGSRYASGSGNLSPGRSWSPLLWGMADLL